MVVRKILETTLTAGQTSVHFTDSDIPLSLIRVYTSDPDLLPIERTLSGNTVTVYFEEQSSNVGVALEIVKAGLDIIDDLTSTDATAALSAKQGKVLKDAIDDIVVPTALSELTDDSTHRLVTDTEKASWNGAVSDIGYYKQTGFLGKNLIDLNNIQTLDITGGGVLRYGFEVDGKDSKVTMSASSITQNVFYYRIITNGVYPASSTVINSLPLTLNLASNQKLIIFGATTNIWHTSISKPQLEYSDVATSYSPYAPSNIELADSKADITSIGTDESGRTTASKSYSQGDIFYKDGFIGEALTSVASGATWTLNTNYKQTTLAEIVAALRA